MKRFLFAPLMGLLVSGYAQDNSTNKGPLTSKAINDTFKQEQQTASAAIQKQEFKQALDQSTKAKKTAAATSGMSEVMVIDPETVSKDWKEAFYRLKNMNIGVITFHLKNGDTLENVSDADILQGGYLMIFTTHGIHGKQYKIIKTADIVSLSTM